MNTRLFAPSSGRISPHAVAGVGVRREAVILGVRPGARWAAAECDARSNVSNDEPDALGGLEAEMREEEADSSSRRSLDSLFGFFFEV